MENNVSLSTEQQQINILYRDGYHCAAKLLESNTKLLSRIVTEFCPHCQTEIEMAWDVKTRGYKAYCPVCGERLMLCDACQHNEDDEYLDDCDYDSCSDSCRWNKNKMKEICSVLTNHHIPFEIVGGRIIADNLVAFKPEFFETTDVTDFTEDELHAWLGY